MSHPHIDTSECIFSAFVTFKKRKKIYGLKAVCFPVKRK